MSNISQGVEYWMLSDSDYNALVTFFAQNPTVAARYPSLLNDFSLISNKVPGYRFAELGSLDSDEYQLFAHDLLDEYDIEIDLGIMNFLLSNLPIHTMG